MEGTKGAKLIQGSDFKLLLWNPGFQVKSYMKQHQ